MSCGYPTAGEQPVECWMIQVRVEEYTRHYADTPTGGRVCTHISKAWVWVPACLFPEDCTFVRRASAEQTMAAMHVDQPGAERRIVSRMGYPMHKIHGVEPLYALPARGHP